MKLSSNLLADIRRLAYEKKSSITDYELFHSRVFYDFIQSKIDSMTGRYTQPIKLTLYDDTSETAKVAFTDGDTISINLKNSIAAAYDSILSRFICMMGIAYHEIAHVLYLDFDRTSRGYTALSDGRFYGGTPTASSPEENLALEELTEALADPAFAKVFRTIYKTIINCLVDAHDEAMLMRHHGSIVRQALITSEESLRLATLPLEQMVQDSQVSNLEIMYDCILQMARFNEIFTSDEKAAQALPQMEKVRSFIPDIISARETDSAKERFARTHKIVLKLWPYIKEFLQNLQQKDQQQPTPDQHQSPTKDQVDAMLAALNNAANNSGASRGNDAPERRKTSQAAKDAMATGQNGNEKIPAAPPSNAPQNDPAQTALDQLLGALAQEQARNEVEAQLAKGLKHSLPDLPDLGSTHKGIPVNVKRPLAVNDNDYALYESLLRDLKGYSKRLQKAMMNILRDLKTGYVQHHRQFGRQLEVSQTYRLDQRCYANKKAPQDLPDMSVAVLVDASGSMKGTKIETATKATILLHDFCRGMDIPVHIASHNTTENNVNYTVYTDFDAVGEKDRYRLAKLHSGAGGSNRDGLALEIAGNALAKRPEEVKLLIIISDGRPSHTSYSGQPAYDDISSIVKKLRRKGVDVIAAAIDDDRDIIRRIYKDAFLDITDLSTLPKTLVSLVKKRILPK